QRGVFLNREMISKEDSGSKIDLEEIQESVVEEPIVNTDTQQEVVTPVRPDDISLPIRRTSDEPANYKEAMASPEAAKWKEAMKSEIQSMYDNQVWNLVDTTPGLKMVGSSSRPLWRHLLLVAGTHASMESPTLIGYSLQSEDESCIFVKVSGSVVVFLSAVALDGTLCPDAPKTDEAWSQLRRACVCFSKLYVQ
ncbi:hypothetical protein Tco_0446119, partial [Tanacetum coccineum]